MLHPKMYKGKQPNANLSPLMKAKKKASEGEKVNFCPFGCQEEDLDDHGYCNHLAGFTLPDDQKTYEPMVMDPQKEKRVVDGRRKLPVPKNAKLERITTCYRVYLPEVKEPSHA